MATGIFDSLGRFHSNIPFTGSSNYVNITGNAEQDSAALTRAQFRTFQQYTQPAIESLLGDAETLLDRQYQGPEIQDARRAARRSSALMEGINERNRSRYGGFDTLTQRELGRMQQRDRQTSIGSAVALTRDMRESLGRQNLAAASDLITRNYTGAANAISQAGINAAALENQNKIAKAQKKAALIQGGIGLASMAGFIALGGV